MTCHTSPHVTHTITPEGTIVERPNDITLDYTGGQDAYALGYARGHDVATARAASRIRLGLPVDDEFRPTRSTLPCPTCNGPVVVLHACGEHMLD